MLKHHKSVSASFAVVLVLLLNLLVLNNQVLAQGSFRISPIEGTVNIVKPESVDIEYKMINNLSSSLNFSLGLPQEEQDFLTQNKLGLELVIDSKVTPVSTAIIPIEIPANTTQIVTVRLKPDITTGDFQKTFNIKLTQTESQTRLSNSNYELKLNVTSKINSEKQSQQQDLFVIGGAVVVAVILILIGLVISKLGKRRDGKESNI